MELPYSTTIFRYRYIYSAFFWATFLNTSDFPQYVKNYLKNSMTTIPISGPRECVNTVHRPEENPKQNLSFSIGNVYWRQMKISTSPHYSMRRRRVSVLTQNPSSHCPGQDGQSQVHTAAFKQGPYSSKWKGESFFLFVFCLFRQSAFAFLNVI